MISVLTKAFSVVLCIIMCNVVEQTDLDETAVNNYYNNNQIPHVGLNLTKTSK